MSDCGSDWNIGFEHNVNAFVLNRLKRRVSRKRRENYSHVHVEDSKIMGTCNQKIIDADGNYPVGITIITGKTM